ncbi:MAG: hypothetical protein II764_02580 [Bacteroidales bacterium]|nr:hypothetical protein [Bacteroidales bacterium]
MKLTIRILLCMAVATMLFSSCGNRKGGRNAVPVEPEAVQTATDSYFQAIDRYFTSEVAPQYAPAAHSITYHDYAVVDDSNPEDIQVLGDFWVENYDIVGDTLMFVSGGNHAGKMHVKKDSAGNYFAPGLDAVGDGSNYLPTARAIFGDRFDEFQKAHSDQDLREQIRKNAISGYVFKNHLGVKYYKDYGWPAVRIPNTEDSSRR